MASQHRTHLINDHVRSPFIAERRRNLFPTTDHDLDMDSGLGHMSPIRFESDSDSESRALTGSETPMSDRTNWSEYMSPLKLSPFTETNLNYTPRKYSPTRDLKTPHDTSTKSVLQKEQKVLLEESKNLKRKYCPISPDGDKKLVPAAKNSKVRTALFQPASSVDISVPPKSFYSKNQEDILEKIIRPKAKSVFIPLKVSVHKISNKNGRRLGQINNGVRHKIKRPKQKKYTVAHKKMIETGSTLNEYIQDLSELKNKQKEPAKQTIKSPETNTNIEIEDIKVVNYFKQLNQVLTAKNQISTPIKSFNVFAKDKENIEALSPLSEVVKTRKFFKSTRNKSVISKPRTFKTPGQASKGLDEEHKVLIEKCHLTGGLNFDRFNLDVDFKDEDISEPQANIDKILSTLTEASPVKNDVPSSDNVNYGQESFTNSNIEAKELISNLNESNITLQASSSILHSEHSILLHDDNFGNSTELTTLVLSPISHMCDVTSGLALSSPVDKRRGLAAMLNVSSRVSKMLSFNSDCHSVDMEEKRKKLFPIFYKGTSSGIETNRQERGGKRERNGDIVKRSAKKFKGLDPDQMLLDAGQKKFGLTLCNECKTMYHMGDPNDETQHLNYHNAHNVLKFSGWKNEHVVANFQSQDRIIRVMPTDSKIWIKKVKDLMQVVLRDMGCYDMEYDLNNSQVYLYIKSRTIAGCVVATSPKEGGHRMLPTIGGISMCSEESYPIKCGLTFMWVAQNFRRQGIASALVTAVKNNFVFGHILSNDDVALTSPTEDGAAFAEKYFNSANFLVYYV